MYMSVGVMKDYKLKLRKLRDSPRLGWSCDQSKFQTLRCTKTVTPITRLQQTRIITVPVIDGQMRQWCMSQDTARTSAPRQRFSTLFDPDKSAVSTEQISGTY